VIQITRNAIRCLTDESRSRPNQSTVAPTCRIIIVSRPHRTDRREPRSTFTPFCEQQRAQPVRHLRLVDPYRRAVSGIDPLSPRQVSVERRRREIREARLESTKAEIAERVRNICVGLSPEEFDALVTRMASVKIKYALRRTADFVNERIDEPS
jgi:hypothetical protein